jgi:hypothetical protein
LRWRKEHNTTPSFREEAPRRKSKSKYWQPKKPKGAAAADMGMILGTNFVVFFDKTKCVCVCVYFAEFCSSSANSTNSAIFGGKIRQSFRCYKIGKEQPLGIWATYFDFMSM